METFDIDCLVVGGGVAGIAVANKISCHQKDVILVEKNKILAQETSSRNSEVIHAGIYYKEGSLKSELCIRGKELLYSYLETRNIPYIKCGKFILATSEEEEKKLFDLYENGLNCGVDDLVINHKDINQYDFLNYVSSIYSPSTGIFDSHSFVNSLKNEFENNKGTILLGNELKEIDFVKGSFEVLICDLNNGSDYKVRTKRIFNCGGLGAINIVNKIKDNLTFQPKYKKGEYYTYSGKEKLNHLIYPIPGQYSLGIHATIDLGKGIRFGPSSYDVSDIDYDVSSEQRDQFYRSIKNYWPNIRIEDLEPSYSGVRPLIEGFDDFVIDIQNEDEAFLLSVLGYASPGLTSSLALAEKIFNKI